MTKSTTPNNATNSDRETTGRFANSNPGGPGNPFARKTAALREAMIDAVTPRDIADIVAILLLNAKGGHLPSMKLLFQYVIGKPKPAVEPDTLDLNELQVLQASQLPSEALKEFTGKLPPELALDTMRALRPAIDLQLRQMIAATIPPADEEPAPLEQQAAAPSPNGENGSSEDDFDDEEMDWNDEEPSPNGAFETLKGLIGLLPPLEPRPRA